MTKQEVVKLHPEVVDRVLYYKKITNKPLPVLAERAKFIRMVGLQNWIQVLLPAEFLNFIRVFDVSYLDARFFVSIFPHA
jgi:hypothetical protein